MTEDRREDASGKRPAAMKTCAGALAFLAGLSIAACDGSPDAGYLKTRSEKYPREFQIVGSSTLSPFITIAAEIFAATSPHSSPVIESTGTGGGIRLFCRGTELNTPSIAMASRIISDMERAECEANGVTDYIEMTFGYDGIVFIGSVRDKPVSLSRKDIYRALAKEIMIDGAFRANPFLLWSDVNPVLPAHTIEVFGPPATSGTRDAFVKLVLEAGALSFDDMKALSESDPEIFSQKALTIRTDGIWVDFGENDGQIVQALARNPRALGVIGFSYLEQSADRVRAAEIDGVSPGFETIVSGQYGLSRPLFLYVKSPHLSRVPALIPFIEEVFSPSAMGPDGYLVDKGLIPLLPAERERIILRFNQGVVAFGGPSPDEKADTL